MIETLDYAVTLGANTVLWFSLIYFPLMFIRCFVQHVQAQVALERVNPPTAVQTHTVPTSTSPTVQPVTTPRTNNRPRRQVQLAGKLVTLYRYHKQDVVKLADLPFTVPSDVKRYSLRKQPAITYKTAQVLASQLEAADPAVRSRVA